MGNARRKVACGAGAPALPSRPVTMTFAPLFAATTAATPFTPEMGIVFAVIAVCFVMLAMEWFSPEVTALAAVGFLVLARVLTTEDALSGFSNKAPITVACMFILGAGLQRTGALDQVTQLLKRMGGRSPWRLLTTIMAMAMAVSAFINNTLVVILFLPIALTMAVRAGVAPSKLAIPVLFAAILGGTCTLIGTSANIVVDGIVQRAGQAAFGMFEFTALGLIVAAVGFAYMLLVGARLLPVRETLTSLTRSTAAREFRTEFIVQNRSSLVGRRIADSALRQSASVKILGVLRGDRPLDPPFDQIVLQEGDRLIADCVAEGVREIDDMSGVQLLPKAVLGLQPSRAEQIQYVEGIISQNSQLIGRTVRELNFEQRYHLQILGVHRRGMSLREKFEDTRLQFGDTLLMQGTQREINALWEDPNFILLIPLVTPEVRRRHAPIAASIVLGVILLAATNIMPIVLAAIFGSLALVLTGCVKLNEAYEAVNWKVTLLVVGMLGLGLALEKSGGAAFLAQRGLALLSSEHPTATLMLSGIYFVGIVLTNLIHHNAVAAVLTPIALQTAAALGLEARPFLIAVIFSVSASFSTPVSYQCNTFAYGAGGYRFGDFLKVGIPLNLLLWALLTWLIPVFWPFTALP